MSRLLLGGLLALAGCHSPTPVKAPPGPPSPPAAGAAPALMEKLSAAGATTVVGFYPTTKLHDRMRASLDALSACVTSPLPGRVRLRFTIALTGVVSSADVSPSEVPDEATRRCLVGVVRGIPFEPVPDIGLSSGPTPVEVVYPLKLGR